jgi:uncharacterized coiled-coil protein SlyX
MKKLLLILLLATARFVTYAQTNLIGSTGNVGIGTASPPVLFNVVVPGAKSGTAGNIGSFISTNDIPSANPFGLRTMIFGGAAIANRYATMQTTDYDLVDGGSIILQPAAGSVGIGTTTVPTGYAFAVNGNAIATSFTVQSYGSWPDYVFKTGYVLPSLNDVKAYIDQNHHLPDVPSAEQVAKDGLNLGDMNKITMQKVEELTMYLIEKDKQLNEQNTTINKQQSQIDTLNAELKSLEARFNQLEDKTN